MNQWTAGTKRLRAITSADLAFPVTQVRRIQSMIVCMCIKEEGSGDGRREEMRRERGREVREKGIDRGKRRREGGRKKRMKELLCLQFVQHRV